MGLKLIGNLRIAADQAFNKQLISNEIRDIFFTSGNILQKI